MSNLIRLGQVERWRLDSVMIIWVLASIKHLSCNNQLYACEFIFSINTNESWEAYQRGLWYMSMYQEAEDTDTETRDRSNIESAHEHMLLSTRT